MCKHSHSLTFACSVCVSHFSRCFTHSCIHLQYDAVLFRLNSHRKSFPKQMPTHFGMLARSFVRLCVCVILTNYYFIVHFLMENLRIHCNTKWAHTHTTERERVRCTHKRKQQLNSCCLAHKHVCTVWHVRILNFTI